MTEYDITRLADAICTKLCEDERFMKNLARAMPKRDNLVSSDKAAKILGVSRFTVLRNANELGGELNARGRWVFRENGLIERFLNLGRS